MRAACHVKCARKSWECARSTSQSSTSLTQPTDRAHVAKPLPLTEGHVASLAQRPQCEHVSLCSHTEYCRSHPSHVSVKHLCSTHLSENQLRMLLKHFFWFSAELNKQVLDVVWTDPEPICQANKLLYRHKNGIIFFIRKANEHIPKNAELFL